MTKSVPIPKDESELSSRLLAAMGTEVSQTEFARRCGISESLLRKYLAGAEPSTKRLVAIADAAGVNVLWLAAGRGPKRGPAPAPSQGQQQAQRAAQQPTASYGPTQPPPALDMARLTSALAAVQEGLQSIKRTLPPDKHAELVAAAYELLDSPATSASNVIRFIKAAA